MTIAFTCHSCSATIRVKPELAGKRGKCPRCSALVQIPVEHIRGQEKVLPKPRSIDGEWKHLVLQKALHAFQGNIAPVRRTLSYRIGIVVVASAMVTLPAIYVGLIVAIGYLLYLHAAVSLPAILAIKHWYAILLLYAGPLIIGVILLFFMVK